MRRRGLALPATCAGATCAVLRASARRGMRRRTSNPQPLNVRRRPRPRQLWLRPQGPGRLPSGRPLRCRPGRHPDCRDSDDALSGRTARAGAGPPRGGKLEFDRAVDVLLESPYGGRTEPRIREHFDRLVDRISTYEVKALAEGDGFTEKKYEPASIDELLALSTTFGTPSAAGRAEDDRSVGSRDRSSTTSPSR